MVPAGNKPSWIKDYNEKTRLRSWMAVECVQNRAFCNSTEAKCAYLLSIC